MDLRNDAKRPVEACDDVRSAPDERGSERPGRSGADVARVGPAITVVGAGYVGLVTAACFAELGFRVVCTDKDRDRIACLRAGECPLFEPGLEDLLQRNLRRRRLAFTPDLAAGAAADIVFLTVGTPMDGDGRADMSAVFEAAAGIAPHFRRDVLLVTKSTVLVGTNRKLGETMRELRPDLNVSVAANPEFLRQGSAVSDFMRPDRVVIGTEDARGQRALRTVYRFAEERQVPIVATSLESAELCKYVANAFLAVKIAYTNEIADLCELVGADVADVARAVGLDSRIGPHCLAPGPGFGGSCFPKDTRALAEIGDRSRTPLRIVGAAVRANEERKRQMAGRILDLLGGSRDATVAVLGLSFKAGTDDLREAPSRTILPLLRDAGVALRVYDPEVAPGPSGFADYVTWCDTAYDAVMDADAVVALTEWDEFRRLDMATVAARMRGDLFIDLRNVADAKRAVRAGLRYCGIGRPSELAVRRSGPPRTVESSTAQRDRSLPAGENAIPAARRWSPSLP